jgi:hypothetical protein
MRLIVVDFTKWLMGYAEASLKNLLYEFHDDILWDNKVRKTVGANYKYSKIL